MENDKMQKGFVALVGAGPGGAGLLTRRGGEYIAKADVVVFDRLVSTEILALIPASVEKIDVGKIAGFHKVGQSDINNILLEQAQKGRMVVRLKGGDPFVFGRGGEELELLEQHAIPFEVVPGITSAIAAPSYAGIPVTHRDFCSSLHIITAHQKENEPLKINFEALVGTGGTLVFLMGVSAVQGIVEGLLSAGMNSSMAAAVIENGARYNQRKVVTSLGQLIEQVQQQCIKSPAVIIVGDVCSLSDKYDWFSKLPLHGMEIVVTRATDKLGSLSNKLRELGASVQDCPCIVTASRMQESVVQCKLKELQKYDWLVFTSVQGVQLFFDELRALGMDWRGLSHLKFGAVGPQTANSLAQQGFVADCVPAVFDGVHLAQALLGQTEAQAKILLVRATQGNAVLREILLEADRCAEDLFVYDTMSDTAAAKRIHDVMQDSEQVYVTFTSASTVEGFVKSLPNFEVSKIRGICIGEQTAQRAKEYGIEHCIATQATIDSMIDKIKEIYDATKRA